MSPWLDRDELRVGLGCLRALTDAPLIEALDLGITVLDTARAYGESERAIGRIVRGRELGERERVRVVTKGGMRRNGNVWRADGRARALLSDCEASLEALGGVPIDTYLIHAPDPSVAWSTTVRALARIHGEKLASRVGVCNVSRTQLDEALDLAPIEAVQVALGPASDMALRNGLIARCIERGIAVIVHSPLGGPKRAGRLARDAVLGAIAERRGCSRHAVMLAALLDLDPALVLIPGSAAPDHVRDNTVASRVVLDDADRDELDARFGFRSALRPRDVTVPETGAEVVLLMGLQGSGKSTLAATYAAQGYERLNRDERGGTLRKLHAVMKERLGRGAQRLVLDNTYTTRAGRFDAVAIARACGATVRGVWLDASIEDAQVNVIERMLAVHGRLLEPDEMERARDPSALPPSALYRTVRALERPDGDEGFTRLETIRFVRSPDKRSRRARFVARDAVDDEPVEDGELRSVFACPHGGGPPRCWCRPPLPGLLLAFARQNDVDLTRSVVFGTSAAHAKMAAAVGARFRQSQRR